MIRRILEYVLVRPLGFFRRVQFFFGNGMTLSVRVGI